MQIFLAHLLTALSLSALITIGSILSDMWLHASLTKDGLYPYREDGSRDPRDLNP